MSVRNHRTKSAVHTWGPAHRASEPRHARWAEKRTKRIGKQAKAAARATKKGERE
jgi:hypothetical protein